MRTTRLTLYTRLEGPHENVFISAVLTPKSHRELVRRVPPQHKTVYAHHMTMAFKPGPMTLEYYRQFEGQIIRIPVLAVAIDDFAQAVLVEGKSENTCPHITISVAEGIEPRYSNDLLRYQKPTRISRFTLEARVAIETLI